MFFRRERLQRSNQALTVTFPCKLLRPFAGSVSHPFAFLSIFDDLSNRVGQGFRITRWYDPAFDAITYNGTWGAGLVQYPGNVVDGLNQYVNDQLCYEVTCPSPATFGPIGGSDVNSASYQQSIQAALAWTSGWLLM